MIVLLRLADLVTMAEVVAVHDVDTLDLRTFSIYPDGRTEVLSIHRCTRGEGDRQWGELPLMAIAPAVEPSPEVERPPAEPGPELPALESRMPVPLVAG